MISAARYLAVAVIGLLITFTSVGIAAASPPSGEPWELFEAAVVTETFTNPCTGLEHEVTFDFEDWVKGTSERYVWQSWWSIETSDGFSAPFKHVYHETFNANRGTFTTHFTANNINANDLGDRFSIHVRVHVTVSATGIVHQMGDASFTCLGS